MLVFSGYRRDRLTRRVTAAGDSLVGAPTASTYPVRRQAHTLKFFIA
jgi:hypothetical protein